MPETNLHTRPEEEVSEIEGVAVKKVKLSDEGTALLQDAPSSDVSNLPDKKPRIKKKKHAILLGYQGKGYFGMQVNKETATIEGELFKAFKAVGIMDDESCQVPQSIQFQRAARTDKGVSAIKQVVSLKMDPVQNEKESVAKLCEHLPDQIRVFAVKRVTNGYSSKLSCDFRSYAYTMPTFAFTPLGQETKEDFRISAELLEQINKTMEIFKGTHRFHNFTARRKPTDPSCRRYIMEFKTGEPLLREGIEFVTISIKGQSFMLHQIRKMVGTVIAITRGLTTNEIIERAWCQDRVDIPIAPPLGLVLKEPHYEIYNKRYGSDGMHESLDWKESEKEVEQFFDSFILPSIVEGEVKERSMMNWLGTLKNHCFDVREDSDHSSMPPGQKLEEEDGNSD